MTLHAPRAARPRVSVLIPVWRAAETLADALGDVAAQTFTDWECLLVLDGADDDSPAIAAAFAQRDPRFRVLAEPHRGIVAALNKGLDECRAELVARFDADDRMHPERLARQLAHLEAAPGTALVSCRVAFDAGHGLPTDLERSGMARHVAWLDGLDTPARLRAARFVDAPVAHPAVMFRRAAVQALGGYRDGRFAEDHDLWLRLFAAGAVFDRVDAVLVTWRDGSDRLTRRDVRYSRRERRALVHAHLVAPGGPAHGRAVRIWGAGEYGRRHAKGLAEHGATVSDFIDIDPKRIGGCVGAGRLKVVAADELGPPDGRAILVAVAVPGARATIAPRLDALGYVEDVDWWALQ